GFQERKTESNPLHEPTNLEGFSKRWKSSLEMVADGVLSKRCTGKGTTFNLDSTVLRLCQDKVRCGFRDDALRCLSTKFESDVRLFDDLLTHLNHGMAFTLSIDRISVISSMGRNTELFVASKHIAAF
ncbi:hypothetical protein L195_g048318, partial [Trifolium pratense]